MSHPGLCHIADADAIPSKNGPSRHRNSLADPLDSKTEARGSPDRGGSGRPLVTTQCCRSAVGRPSRSPKLAMIPFSQSLAPGS